METTNVTLSPPLSGQLSKCICCQAEIIRTLHRQPICSACVAPGEARSYCAKCGHRGDYPYDDFLRVMSRHYQDIKFSTDIAVRLPVCEHCKSDGRPPMEDGLVRFFGINFD